MSVVKEYSKGLDYNDESQKINFINPDAEMNSPFLPPDLIYKNSTSNNEPSFVNSQYTEEEFLQMLRSISTATEMKNFILQYYVDLGLDLSTYDSLSSSNQIIVVKILMNSTYSSIYEFQSIFDKIVKLKIDNSESNTGGSGGGSSGGSGGGGTFYPFSLSLEVTDNDNNLLDIITANQKVYLTVNVDSRLESTTFPTLIVGVYSPQKQLINVFLTENLNFSSAQSQTYRFECNVNPEYSVKAFILDNTQSLLAQSNSVHIPIMEPIPEYATSVRGYITEVYSGTLPQGYMNVSITETLVDGVWIPSEQTCLIGTYDLPIADALGCYVQLYVNNYSNTLCKRPIILHGETVSFTVSEMYRPYGNQIEICTINGDRLTYDISPNPTIYYNNVLAPNKTLLDIETYKNAYVRLLNNNPNSSGYNVIMIDDYVEGLVSSVDLESNTVTFIDGTTLKLRSDTVDANINFIKNKRVVNFSDIEANDVLSVLGHINENGVLEYGSVAISNKVVVGKFYEYSVESLSLDNRWYRISKSVSDQYEKKEIGLGYTMTAYLNNRGQIIYATVDIREYLKYGFATIMTKEQRFGENIYSIHLLKPNGEWYVHSTMDYTKFYVNVPGIPTASSRNNITMVDLNKEIGYIGVSAIMNQVNPNASTATYVINKVIAYSGRNIYFLPTDNPNDIFYGFTDYNCTYDSTNNNIGYAKADDSTAIFSVNYIADGEEEYSIPTTEDLNNHRDLIKVGTKNDLTDGQYINQLSSYNLNKDKIARAMMGKGIITK